LLNAGHFKNIPGHKTDKIDSPWLSKLLLCELLKWSFIRPCESWELLYLVSFRKKIAAQTVSEKKRIIKILEDANIKLSSVLSNVYEVVGTNITNNMIQGNTDINPIMKFYHGKIKSSKEEFRLTMEGKITKHHQFMIQIHKDSISDQEKILKRIYAEIDDATKSYQIEIELLQTIPGIGKASALVIISETGIDMERFPN
jgi:transposase